MVINFLKTGLLSSLWQDVPIRIQRLMFLVGLWLIPLAGALWTLHHAPGWLEPRELQINLAPGQQAVLGHHRARHRDDLWSSYADAKHIRILRAADRQWWLENISARKRVLWKPHGTKTFRRVREWRLIPGGQFTIGPHRFTVTAVSANDVVLQSETATWRYDGQMLSLNGQTLPPCNPPSLLDVFRGMLKKKRAFSFGGGVQCATRIGLPDSAPDQAIITPVATGYVLRPGSTAGSLGDAPIGIINAQGSAITLRDQWVPLTIGDVLIIGYTRYQVQQTRGPLVMSITARGQRWLADQPIPTHSPNMKVILTPLTWSDLIPINALLIMGLVVIVTLSTGMLWLRGRYLIKQPSWWVRLHLSLSLGLALGSLALYPWDSNIPPHLAAYPLAWLACAAWLWPGSRSGWSTLLVGCWIWLLGWALIAQLQMGLGADESIWLRYGAVTAALSSAIGWLLSSFLLFQQHFQPIQRLSEYGIILATALSTLLTLIALGIQMVSGNEAGLGLLQPIEPTKLLLVITVALALAYRMNLQGWDTTLSKPYLWLRYLGPGIILAMIVGFALLFLHDFSPIMLLGISAFMLAWAYLRIHVHWGWRWGGQCVLAAIAILLISGIIQLRQHPEWFPGGLQSERIQVWAAPDLYPHTGYQLRRGLMAIRAGGWLGINSGFFAGNPEPGRNGRVMSVPALQDDFAPTFFLNRYGGLMGLLLLAVQLLLVLALLGIGTHTLKRAARNDYHAQLLSRFAYFLLAGGSGLLAAHILVSWGTNLGFLPVMGQPMPLLSSAGSHMVFLVAPIMALALVLEIGDHHAK